MPGQSETAVRGRLSKGLSAKGAVVTAAAVAASAMVVYALTCFRTITWWDNSEYALAAITLGVAHPPGSLVTTLLGWVATVIPWGCSKILTLNLLAAAAAAVTAALVCLLAADIMRKLRTTVKNVSDDYLPFASLVGLFLGSLALAFGETLWTYALKFTPYVFTAVLTAALLWAMWRWWEHADEPGSRRRLVLVAFLFGLDFCVHRTNLLMLPGLLVWVLLRRAGTLGSAKVWVLGILGFAGGLAVHLLTIPMAARQPFLNINDPSSLTALWDYVSLKQYGGGWLVNLYPRKAPLWPDQIMDYVNVFRANFFSVSGSLSVLGILPGLLGLTGLALLWRQSGRLALGLVVLFLCAGAGAIIYFNVPANFFRSMDRHYLPSLVIFAVWIAYGAASILRLLWTAPGRLRWAVVLAGLLMVARPAGQLTRNYRALDASDNTFTDDYARNVFATLPDDAIFFSGADNDTWPLWYLQVAENLRPDVGVLNINLLNTPWYVSQLIARNPTFPLELSPLEISQPAVRPWRDTTLALPVFGTLTAFDLREGGVLPDTLRLQVAPTVGGKYLFAHDWVILRVLTKNEWRRPVYFTTAMGTERIPYLRPYLRLEGYARRVVPVANAPAPEKLLQRNLIEKYSYRGYAAGGAPLEPATKWMAWGLYEAFAALAAAQSQGAGDSVCVAVKSKMFELLPPERLTPPAQLNNALDQMCLPPRDTAQSAR